MHLNNSYTGQTHLPLKFQKSFEESHLFFDSNFDDNGNGCSQGLLSRNVAVDKFDSNFDDNGQRKEETAG